MDAILRASYGDKDQHLINEKRPASIERARRIKEEFDRQRRVSLQIPRDAEKRGYKPPFWDTKRYGIPYVKRTCPGQICRSQFIEANRGVIEELRQDKQCHHSKSLIPRGEPGPMDPSLSKEMDKLMDIMRGAIRARSRPHIPPRIVLLSTMSKVLSKRYNEIGDKDTLSGAEFIAAWKSMNVTVNAAQAWSIFNKYGQNSEERMPVLAFCDALLVGASRLAMKSKTLRNHHFEQEKKFASATKIIYPQCKQGVFAPSNFTHEMMAQSCKLPDAKLTLEFVYGYDGINATANNIFITDRGSIVYYTAAVGIVYNRKTNEQKFFQGHDDDILCAAITNDRSKVATGQCGRDPCVIVWDPDTLLEMSRLHHGYGFRGIQCVYFSQTGSKLACIATDNNHSLFIWDLRRKQIVLQQKTQPGAPPTVYGAVWSIFEHSLLVSFGQNHIKFWKIDPARNSSGQWGIHLASGRFGQFATHSILCACFLPSGTLLTGTPEGKICTWKSRKCVQEQYAHERGPSIRRPDGISTNGGVTCLIMLPGHQKLASGGADGYVKIWDVSSGEFGGLLKKIPFHGSHEVKSAPPLVKGLAFCQKADAFVVGTSTCDLLEVGNESSLLVFGHRADIHGLAMNPKLPHMFATVCESQNVAIWNAESRKVVKVIMVKQKASCGAFSPGGTSLAVGMMTGGIKVFKIDGLIEQIAWCKTFGSAVRDMKYSPNGNYLAAASCDQFIDVFEVCNGYKRISRCRGHSSTVLHIDWSLTGDAIQANDQAYEVLYFKPLRGSLLKLSQKDTQWATWTCVLGFPVMGIWPKDSDGTDINACDRSPSSEYLVTADDYGKIKLFRYPCVSKNAPASIYSGHSSHIMNVRWSCNGEYVVSVGGRDRSVFQWKFHKVLPTDREEIPVMRPLDDQQVFWGS